MLVAILNLRSMSISGLVRAGTPLEKADHFCDAELCVRASYAMLMFDGLAKRQHQ